MSFITERLPLDAVISAGVFTGATVANLQDDPDSPDANWATSPTDSDPVLYVSFPDTEGVALTASQDFRVLVRKNGTTLTVHPTARIELWEDGSFVRAGPNTSVTSGMTPIVLSFAWVPSEVGDLSLVELKVVVVHATQILLTSSIDVGAVSWSATSVPDLGGLSLYGTPAHASRNYAGRTLVDPTTTVPYRAIMRRNAA